MRPSRRLLVAAGLVVLAAILRFRGISSASMWLDEALTLELTAGRGYVHETLPTATLLSAPPDLTSLRGAAPVAKVWTTLSGATHPPLYFVLLRLWRETWGEGDAAARSLSAVASVVAVLLLFLSATESDGFGVAVWASLAMALAAPQIRLAQETRNYTVPLAFALAAAWALLAIEKRGPRAAPLAVLAVGLLGAVLGHYFTFGPVAALGVYTLVRLRGASRRRVLVVFAAVAVVALLAWGPFLFAQTRLPAGQDWWAVEKGPEHLRLTAARLLFLPAWHFLVAPEIAPWTFVFAGLFYAAAVLCLRKTTLFTLWALFSIAIPLGVDLFGSMKLLTWYRYVFFAAPGVFVVVARSLSQGGERVARVAPALPVLLCLIGLPEAYAPFKGPWREFARFVDEKSGPDDALVFSTVPGQDPEPGALYIQLARYLENPHPVMLLDAPPSPAVKRTLAGRNLLVFTQRVEPPTALRPEWEIGEWMPLGNAAVAWRLRPASAGASRAGP